MKSYQRTEYLQKLLNIIGRVDWSCSPTPDEIDLEGVNHDVWLDGPDRGNDGEFFVPAEGVLASLAPYLLREVISLRADVKALQPHHYSPDYQAMGDCRICGWQRDQNPAHK